MYPEDFADTEPGWPMATGFFRGNFAEVVIYFLLSTAMRTAMRNQLENETPMALCTFATRNRSARLGSARLGQVRQVRQVRSCVALVGSARKLGSQARLGSGRIHDVHLA